ncbi:probable 2-oxoglutarate-dependent dioxygenase SLC1 [Hevea brasiliensis]|uniref:probable 2-oxoglutarate-dependent dioxygenase SLC1 n=1 Tax=Hevea brasiliensis TaxID=3981 RepID=UPI0025D212E7|nr:probable 2-oxoglutarate-dependent dioxygenase SLC1 [Hevea brasiliensis]
MCPSIAMAKENDEALETQFQKGVKRLYEKGIDKIPNKYILPVQERPNNTSQAEPSETCRESIKLPIIDFAELQGSNRPQVLKSLADACKQYGFFQLVNHGIPKDVIRGMVAAAERFFELPYKERSKYMSSDMQALVRYGTSFNQNKDSVFCWRDFLKLMCHPLPDVLPHWPSSPTDFRKLAATYSKQTKYLFLMVMEAILESLLGTNKSIKIVENDDDDNEIMKDFQDGSQLMMVNFYPPCPEPDLTLGMPPHSDYGFLTLLLQDEVEGLQIQYMDKWVTVESIPNAFVVNVGDHLEIFSNGKYKSVLHRVKVNSTKSRISVASLHTLPFKCMVRPWSKLIDAANPRRYKDTNFATFLDYISTRDPKNKEFLDSRKLTFEQIPSYP